MAIYRGFASQIPDLKLLLCAYHLQRNDALNIREFVCQKGALKNIIGEIYGRNCGGVKELRLVDSTDIDDLRIKLEGLKSVWDNLCPSFHKWFSKNRASFFEESVIEKPRTGTKVQRVYYNNSIESQHFREKMEKSYKKRTLPDVISTLKKLVDRQKGDEIRAVYGPGPYRLSTQYAKFQMDSVKCILWMPKNEISMFRYFDSMEQWNKSLKSLRKAGKSKRKTKKKKGDSINLR